MQGGSEMTAVVFEQFENDEIVIAKCGHEVRIVAAGTASETVPDCCDMCQELIDAGMDFL